MSNKRSRNINKIRSKPRNTIRGSGVFSYTINRNGKMKTRLINAARSKYPKKTI